MLALQTNPGPEETGQPGQGQAGQGQGQGETGAGEIA